MDIVNDGIYRAVVFNFCKNKMVVDKETWFKIRLKQLRLRLVIGFRIIFGYNKHFFICSITEDNLRNLIIADTKGYGDYTSVEIGFTYHRLQPYNVFKMVEIIYDQNDKIDMALHKANFEAMVELTKNEKK